MKVETQLRMVLKNLNRGLRVAGRELQVEILPRLNRHWQ